MTLERSASLLCHIRAVLRAAIKYGGTTFMDYRNADGRPGGFQHKHRVYNRAGEPCRTCGAPIIRIQAAGRSTHLCPACQPPSRVCRVPSRKPKARASEKTRKVGQFARRREAWVNGA